MSTSFYVFFFFAASCSDFGSGGGGSGGDGDAAFVYIEVTAFVVCNLQPLKTMPTIIFSRKKDEPESVKQELKTERAQSRVAREM